MADDDRLGEKLSPPSPDDGARDGAAPCDATDHAAGAGPESSAAGGERQPDPRDPESAGTENLRVPGEDA